MVFANKEILFSESRTNQITLDSIALAIASIGLVVFLAYVFAGIFERTRIPDVLFLVATGIILGPVSGLVQPGQFGVIGAVFTTLTLIIILFEGGTTLTVTILRSTLGPAVWLALLGFFVTMAVSAATAMWLTDMGLPSAFILGAIVASTSESIVIPLIKQMKVNASSQAVLSLESSINDVLSIVIALALIGATKAGSISIAAIEQELIANFVVAIVFGITAALLWYGLRQRVSNLKESMLATPAFLLVTYGFVALLGFNGAIASLAFGIALGNIQFLPFKAFKQNKGLAQNERALFNEIAFIMKSFFFVYLGISLKFAGSQAILVALIMVVFAYILRLPVVKITAGRHTPPRDASVIAILIPKGLAAIVLASIPLSEGIPGGEIIMNVTYAAVLCSILITAVLVYAIDRTSLGKFYLWFFSLFIPRKSTMETGSENLPAISPLTPEPQQNNPSSGQGPDTPKDDR